MLEILYTTSRRAAIMKKINSSAWVEQAISSLKYFESTYSSTYVKREREYYSLFEIGCFINIINVYISKGFSITVNNLKGGVFKYLTTPNGNPDNFSYVVMRKEDKEYQLRQQVRIVHTKNERIYFTPDIVIIKGDADILIKKDPLYANGSRRFFYVDSSMTVAAHECKSLEPFPELFASFVGMFMLAHDWSMQKVKKISNTYILPLLSLLAGSLVDFFYR